MADRIGHGAAARPTIGVYLSGGGVRAALHGLGVLLYLARAGLLPDVRVVQSVSGGSILNAVLAAHGDIARADAGEVERLCSRLASRLALQGAFFLPTRRARKQILGCYALVAVMLVPIGLMRPVLRGATPATVAVTAVAVVAVAFGVTGTVFVVLRRFGQYGAFDAIIRESASDPMSRAAGYGSELRALLGRARPLLSEIPESSVLHVFCATDLISGQPVFFSRNWTFAARYGRGPANLPLVKCVYASAAFPGVFPPQFIAVDPLEWSGGIAPDERPAGLVVVDGGVYNNLGTELRDAVERVASYPLALDGVDVVEPALRLIVNASAPARPVSLPRRWPARGILSFVRTVTVLYESTVHPRLQQLRHDSGSVAVLDISESPLSIAKAYVRSDDPEIRARAAKMVEELEAPDTDYWARIVDKASRYRTTLQAIGYSDAARIIRHGYLQASVTMRALGGAPGPAEVPQESWFARFVKSTTSEAGGS